MFPKLNLDPAPCGGNELSSLQKFLVPAFLTFKVIYWQEMEYNMFLLAYNHPKIRIIVFL